MHNPSSGGDTLMGTVEAAAYLRVHRTTVNYAVSRGELKPDALTPGGHYRFKRATLDAYRAQVNQRGPGGKSAQMGAQVSERSRLLAKLMRMAAADEDISEIAREAISGLMALHPDLAMGYACERRETDRSDPYAIRLLAGQGIDRGITSRFNNMRTYQGFAVVAVMAQGQEECCNNVDDPEFSDVKGGTRLMMSLLGGKSYVVLPLKGKEKVIGLLGFMSKSTYAFSDKDLHEYRIVADLLATKLHDRRHRAHLERLLQSIGVLAHKGLFSYARANRVSLGERLRDLAGEFRDATGATSVGTDGLMVDIHSEDVNVQHLARDAQEAPLPAEDDDAGELAARIWHIGDRPFTGVRQTIPLIGQEQAGIAAAWNELKGEWPNNHAALRVLAVVCALAQARARLVDGGQHQTT